MIRLVLGRACVKEMVSKWENNAEVQVLREYLRIPSVHPEVDYNGCVDFLRQQASSLDLQVQVVEVAPKNPVVIITWPGLKPQLPSIMLNSHMDVVPVYDEFWTHPPFSAHLTGDGWIYARGSQDMKTVGIHHLEAVRRLKTAGKRLRRTVHVTFVPDEEMGGKKGMSLFAKTPEFQALNVGFALDESMPSIDKTKYVVFYGERLTRQFKITCLGEPNHGSLMPSDTAGEKLQSIINRFMSYREAEKRKLDTGRFIGDVTSVNLTQVSGGVQVNVLPERLSASFDVRLSPDVDPEKFEEQVKTWCKASGPGVSYEFLQWNPRVESTKLDDSNSYWIALKASLDKEGFPPLPLICPGATDARYLRMQGIPAIGLSLLKDCPLLLHAHDERILVQDFLQGLDIMEKVVEACANV